MSFFQKYAPRVPKTLLLLFAGIVWCFAGYQILNIGVSDMVSHWNIPVLDLIAAAVVFTAFFLFVFSKMVRKHHKRICGYEKERICMFAFFDVKGYIIMSCMITFGILLRNSHVVPPLYLGTFYTGLGTSLAVAGICFLVAYVKRMVEQKGLTAQ